MFLGYFNKHFNYLFASTLFKLVFVYLIITLSF